MEKAELRRIYKGKRQFLGEEKVEDLSNRIKTRLLDFLKKNPALNHIHIFLPIELFIEVNTLPLLQDLFQLGKTTYSSSLNPGKKNKMKTVQLNPDTVFQIDAWGIPVPVNPTFVDPDPIQLVLVPLLAFDRKGYRLGYGKGYYDIFLSGLDKDVIKVGLSFFPPEEKLPIEDHDVPLNFCITPQEIFAFG